MIDDAALGLVLASTGFSLLALLAARSFAIFARSARLANAAAPTNAATPADSAHSARRGDPQFLPPVSLLVPLRGTDARAEEIYRAFCHQEYPAYQVVFGVRDADDPAVPLVERLMASMPHRDIALVVGGEPIGSNPKVNNLHNMMARARHGTLVMTDADILVTRDYLAHVVAPLAEPHVGLVTCLYRSSAPVGLAARLEGVGVAGEFAPRVLAARLVEGIRYGFGATLATTKSVLDEVGGLRAVADYLAEDFKLGSLIRRAGYEVRLSEHVVETVMAPAGMGAMLRHQLRWNRTIRACRPGGYLALLLAHATTLATVSLLLDHATLPALLIPVSAVLVELLAAWVVGVHILGDRTFRRDFWLLPFRDLLDFAVWCAGFLGKTVEWRGSTFRVVGDGRLVPRASR